MPFQVCAGRPRCANLVERGFCEACKAKGCGKDARPSSTQRGYGSRWQKARAAYLARNPRCVDPFGDHGVRIVASEHVDHIVPHRGDMVLFWDEANWQALCETCHDRKTATEDGGFGRARMRR